MKFCVAADSKPYQFVTLSVYHTFTTETCKMCTTFCNAVRDLGKFDSHLKSA